MTEQPTPLPIGHTTFAAIMDGIADQRAADAKAAAPDTLPQWLRYTFGSGLDTKWADLHPTDRAYWEHQAKAVRGAVERNGFKDPNTPV
jgi:hypothetical protein